MTDTQNFGGMGELLKGIAENPEMLSKAMNLASTLSASGALDGLLGGTQAKRETPSQPIPPPEMAKKTGTSGLYRERIALLEAMLPFISDTKRDRLELLIRILGVMELYDGVIGKKPMTNRSES